MQRLWPRVIVPAFGFVLLLSACAQLSATVPASSAETNTADAYGSYLSARLAASDHDLPEAARLYRESLAIDPENSELLGRAFLYTAASGDMDEAAKLAERVVKTDPGNRAARLALAVVAIKRHDFTEARKNIGTPEKGEFTVLTLSLLDAWAAQGAGDTTAALTDLKQITPEGGAGALAAYHRGLILELAGRPNEAEAAYREALGLAASSPRVIEAYGRLLERSGRIADARAFYAKYASDPGLSPILAAANARLAAGTKPDHLIATAEQGAAEALFGIAASLNDSASADVAVLYLQFVLYLAPDFDLAKIVLADRFESLKKYADAIALYRSIDSNSPYAFAAAVQTALDESRLDQKDKAISDLVALTRSRPDDLTAWTALGDAYRSLEKYEDAIQAYDHAIGLLNPVTSRDWPLFYARGVSEERSHHWDTAEKDLQQALKLSPDQPEVLNYLGYSWVDQGRNLPQAVAMLEKARALSPTDGYIVDSVGWAYYRLGRYADAAKTLEEAVLLVPGDPTINEHLGDAYWRLGRKLDARFQWSHALAFGAADKQKTEIEKKLQTGIIATARQGS